MKIEAQVRLVNVEEIIPNRFQPRLDFNDEKLSELAESIRVHGIIQPLVLRRIAGKFEIIAGERRYKAANLVGLKAVPAIIADLNDNDSAEVAIIENTHRKDMSAIEEARSYKKLLDRKYVTQDQLAKRLGTSQSNIANKLRLLSLDDSVQDALVKERISERHARGLLRITDKYKQVELLNRIIEEKWPVRKLEEEVDKILGTYKEDKDQSGNIRINRGDVKIEDIMNKSQDVKFDIPEDYVPNKPVYQYQSKVKTDENKKTSFFNDLENESANMDPTISFGFNPFENRVNTIDSTTDDLDEPEVDKELENKSVLDEKIDSVESTLSAIQKLKQLAIENEIPLKLEEFDFDKIHQFIIRIDKDE